MCGQVLTPVKGYVDTIVPPHLRMETNIQVVIISRSLIQIHKSIHNLQYCVCAPDLVHQGTFLSA